MPKMRRNLKITVFVLYLSAVLLAGFLVFDFAYARSYYSQLREPRQLTQVQDSLYLYGNVSNERVQQHKMEYNFIPEWLTNRFYVAGGSVFLSDTFYFPVDETEYRSAWGMFQADGRYSCLEIWIYHGSMDELTAAHEFGHYLDYILRWESQSEKFRELFDLEQLGFALFRSAENPNLTEFPNPYEYFAEFFAWYSRAVNGDDASRSTSLMENFPETFAYFEDIFSKNANPNYFIQIPSINT